MFFSKKIGAMKPTKQNIIVILTRCFVNYQHYFVNVITENYNFYFQKGYFLNVPKNNYFINF